MYKGLRNPPITSLIRSKVDQKLYWYRDDGHTSINVCVQRYTVKNYRRKIKGINTVSHK